MTPNYPALRLLVGGRWIDASDRPGTVVENPATRARIGEVPGATAADVDEAIEAAGRSARDWRETSPYTRADILHRAVRLLRERREAIGEAMTLENGKPLGDAIGEVDYTADIIDFFAGQAARSYGRVLPTSFAEGRTLLAVEPVGTVAAFTPWNYPLTVPGRKVGAALAAGCPVIIKPAKETPASAIALAEALVDAGLPAGVLSMLFGDPAMISQRLIDSPVVRKVSFTGSHAVGVSVAAKAAAVAKPVMLELGGHAPVIVFDDVDVEAVCAQALGAKIHNTGQSCGSPIRFFVHERVHARFVECYARLLDAVRVGDGFDPATQMGPLADVRRFQAMEAFTADALDHGAEVVAGGHGDDSVGYFYRPTLFANAPADSLIMRDEPFGPMAATATFADEDEVVTRANALPYGLGAYVFTTDAGRALRVPQRLDFGMVSVNRFGIGARDTFFGGRKESGFGSEGGPEALEEYQTYKLIAQA
jgi:succinate-semialdehyde dehydrogenase/glutarate-semialdehyde dehydrogenase